MIKGKKRTTNTTKYSLFTGEAYGKIVAVNPGKENYIKLRGLTNVAEVEDPVYTGIELELKAYDPEEGTTVKASREYSAIDFYLSYNPNKIMGLEEDKYAEKIDHMRILISNRLDMTKIKDVEYVRLIDAHCQMCMVPYLQDKTAKECLEDAQSYPDVNQMVLKVNPETVRFAREGEQIIYQILYNASSLAPHNPNAEGDRKNELFFQFTKEDGSDAWDEIVDGNFLHINNFLKSEWVRDTEGNRVELGFFLVINAYQSNGQTKFYNQIFTSPFASTTFRTTANEKTYVGKDGENYTTKLNKQAFNSLMYVREKGLYLWDNTKFTEFDKNSYNPAETSVVGGSNDSNDEYDDDLPF